MDKVATDTNILDLRTRYRSKLGWFFWFRPIQRYYTTMGKWQILYLRTRYRSKLGWFFWFGPIHATIRRNLGVDIVSGWPLYANSFNFVRTHKRPLTTRCKHSSRPVNMNQMTAKAAIKANSDLQSALRLKTSPEWWLPP